MKKAVVIYWSGTGNTEAMAQFVREGIQSAGGAADFYRAEAFDASLAGQYDIFALGCPAMGQECREESEFEPLYKKLRPMLKDRAVVLFGSYGWGDGEWMRQWESDCRNLGAKLLSEPLIVQGAPTTEAQHACRMLGGAIAGFAVLGPDE